MGNFIELKEKTYLPVVLEKLHKEAPLYEVPHKGGISHLCV